MSAQVTKVGIFSCQVCAPTEWTDEQVANFAEQEVPCGTTHGWRIRKGGADERVNCELVEGHVHILLDA